MHALFALEATQSNGTRYRLVFAWGIPLQAASMVYWFARLF